MLLDEKRTKRIVRIIAILTSLAFAGVGAIAVGLFLVGGGNATPTQQAVKDARGVVKDQPNSAKAWGDLAAALQGDGKTAEAITTARKAVSLAPGDFDQTQILVSALIAGQRQGEAITVLQRFTSANAKEADAFLQLGQLAQEANRIDLARLSYLTYLKLRPQGATAQAVRERLASLKAGGVPTTTTP